jgi:hypothetical protein
MFLNCKSQNGGSIEGAAGLMHDRRVEEQQVEAELLFGFNAWVVLVVVCYL